MEILMHRSRLLFLFLVACGSAAMVGTAAACESTLVGAQFLDPEKNSIGTLCDARDVQTTGALGSTHILYALPIQAVGAALGDAEKDTLAYTPLAED